MHQGRRRVCSEAEGTGAMIGEKLTAAAEVCCACHLPQAMRKQVRERMAAGHAEHAGEGLPGDLQAEAREELADVAGYAALARMTGEWGWRWALAVLLAGLAWRVLGDARGPPRGRDLPSHAADRRSAQTWSNPADRGVSGRPNRR